MGTTAKRSRYRLAPGARATDRPRRNRSVAGRTAGVRKVPVKGTQAAPTPERAFVVWLLPAVVVASGTSTLAPSVRLAMRVPAAREAPPLTQPEKAYWVE